MNRIPVKSTNVKSVGYLDGVLEVEFANGVYSYQGVPPEKYDALMKAPSIGKYVASEIKPHFTAVKI